MIKILRKHNKWFMVGFGILLMLAWLVAPATSGLTRASNNRAIATLDGRKVSRLDMTTANREISALDSFSPGITQALGISGKDPVHWLLLTREAEDAGLVGGENDGHLAMEQLIRGAVQQRMNSDFQFIISVQNLSQEEARKAMENYMATGADYLMLQLQQQGLNKQELGTLFARLSGVDRLVQSYRRAARVSDRQAVATAREVLDGATVDAVFIPASLTAGSVPEPDDAALQAQFERFKGARPGEGEFGIGYLLPRRVKLEWMTLDRKSFEDAVRLDPVEVRKRHTASRARYPGDFAAERANVERDMRGEAVDRAMQEAHLVIQSEVLKATRRLEPDGPYKKIPEGWERPRFETIAQAVAEGLRKVGMEATLPSVTTQTGKWLTESDLRALPGIGFSSQRQGGITIPFPAVVMAAREVGGPGVSFPVQVGIPLAEHYLTDASGNRYYITVLASRGESPPDSMDEIREQLVKDYKQLRAFESLKAKTDDLRQIAIEGGLDAAATAAIPTPAAPAQGAEPPKAPEVVRAITITRKQSGGNPNLDDQAVRDAVASALEQIDPLTPYGQIDPAKATVVVPSAKHLGIAVIRIQAAAPLSREEYRRSDTQAVAYVQNQELQIPPGSDKDPFSLARLLERHEYSTGDQRIKTPADLKRGDDEG